MKVQAHGKIESHFTCTHGGFHGSDKGYTPLPLTDCPQKENPITLLPSAFNTSSGCMPFNSFQGVPTAVIFPGKYCGGLKIDGVKASLQPGVYFISDRPLEVVGAAELIGDGVTFVFESDSDGLIFGPDTKIDISAPTSGVSAGLLIYQFDLADDDSTFLIKSNDARKIVGTIYLPKGRMEVDASSPVAADSAYTALIVRELKVKGDARLVLNSDYEDTDVPVPIGLVEAGEVRLRE